MRGDELVQVIRLARSRRLTDGAIGVSCTDIE